MKINDLRYQVSWDSYQDHLKSMLQEIMTSTEYTDVTLVSDDLHSVRAHKVILSAVSPVLKSILNNVTEKNSAIYLRGIMYQDLQSIMEYIYLGETTLSQEKINEFLNIARNLQVKDIGNTSYNAMTSDPTVNKTHKEEEFHGKEERKDEIFQENEASDTQNQNESLDDTGCHDKSSNATCKDCGKTFESKWRMVRHSKAVHEQVSFACDYCKYTSTTITSVRMHTNAIHEKIKYPCNQCDYQATQKGSLRLHIKSKHEGIRYPCDQCDYQSGDKGNLKKHILTHHKGVKFSCEQCDRVFFYKSDLGRHYRKKHTIGSMLMKCTYCNFETPFKSGLRAHNRKEHSISEPKKITLE